MDYKNKNILIVGGSSDVGMALAMEFAKLGSNLTLTQRKDGQLNDFKCDIEIRFLVKCSIVNLDITDFKAHSDFLSNLKFIPDIVVFTVGVLYQQEQLELNFEKVLENYYANLIGIISVCDQITKIFERRGSGIIIGISSVAGDRGRGSNFYYGSAKAGFSAYLSGLRNKLYKSNIDVITVKPGFIRTKMISHLKTPSLLTTTPKNVAIKIISAVNDKNNIIYVGWYWRFIMFVIKLIPEPIFKKLNL